MAWSAFPASGPSATITSVVSSNDAIDAACCNATRSRVVEGVLDARLLLFHLGLGGRPHLDDGDAAGELRETLLELLPIIVRGRLLDLRPDLLDAALDLLGATGALDDRGVVLVHDHLLGAAEVIELEVFELDAEVLRDRLAPGHGRDVLEHG